MSRNDIYIVVYLNVKDSHHNTKNLEFKTPSGVIWYVSLDYQYCFDTQVKHIERDLSTSTR